MNIKMENWVIELNMKIDENIWKTTMAFNLINNSDSSTKYFYISPVKGLVGKDEYIRNPPIDMSL